MEWLKQHSSIAWAFIVVLAIVGAMVLVSDKFATDTITTDSTWGSGAFVPSYTSFSTKDAPGLERRVTEEELFTLLANSEERTYVTLDRATTTYETLNPKVEDGVYQYTPSEIDQLISSINTSAYIQPANPEEEITLEDVYGYLPSGLVALSNTDTRAMNETQSALYDYANEAGSYIESHFESWGNRQAAIMRRFIEDPTDDVKRQEALEFAEALITLGEDLSEIERVPTMIQKDHAALSEAYIRVGRVTETVINAEGEQAFLNAINASNNSADALAKVYIAIVDILTVNGVKFNSTDPGRVFSFSSL